jgi:hypothetical protein
MAAGDIARAYLWFADHEAAGRSELYRELALGVAADPELLELLAALPAPKRQPNLLFTSVRYVCGEVRGFAQFRDLVQARRDEVIACILTHRTQTNEPARCATLLPLMAMLPRPLALIEVGASAGLCLLIDRYGYDYGNGRQIRPVGEEPAAPVFRCAISPDTPLPAGPLEVSWRAGLDLNPLDLEEPDDVAWLEALVWPGEGDRLTQLRQAIALARRDPPRVIAGDLRTDLPALLGQAPPDATVVVFHTAVLAYLTSRVDRLKFAATVQAHGARWIANESPGVLSLTGSTQPSGEAWPTGDFLLALDRQPFAWTDPHGASLTWIP